MHAKRAIHGDSRFTTVRSIHWAASKFARQGELIESILTQCFIKNYRDAVREIEGAEGAPHRDADGAVVILTEDRLVYTLRLLPEDDIISVFILDVHIGLRRLRGGEIQVGARRDVFFVLLVKIRQILVNLHRDFIPIVQPRTAERLLIQREAERLDEMKGGVRRGASAGDVAGVLWDLRFQ